MEKKFQTMEALVNAYKIESFSKINEMMAFDRKLQMSFHRVGAQILTKHIMVLTYCDRYSMNPSVQIWQHHITWHLFSVESLSCVLKLSRLTDPHFGEIN